MNSGLFSDHFSSVAATYALHRPLYPRDLFVHLTALAPARTCAWDCGTGNGQAAIGLAEFFDVVIATDASASQIEKATEHAHVRYRVATAENPGLSPRSINLISVAQALHWFDLTRFYAQANHVLSEGGVLAAWCYGRCRIEPQIDAIIDTLYHDILGPYWPPERRYIDDAYGSIYFPYKRMPSPGFEIHAQWRADDVLGYLRTWSAAQRYTRETGRDPIGMVTSALIEVWADANRLRMVSWPIHLLAGRR
ncbi:MAG: class I SAM-dependent methyltransferase [Acidiferrobacterales bacterium]